MRKNITGIVVLLLVLSVTLAACTQKVGSSSEAISATQSMRTVKEKTDYLIQQASVFLSSEEFDEAIKIAKHVLAKLDSDSEEAQTIIELAKEQIARKAQGVVADFRR